MHESPTSSLRLRWALAGFPLIANLYCKGQVQRLAEGASVVITVKDQHLQGFKVIMELTNPFFCYHSKRKVVESHKG